MVYGHEVVGEKDASYVEAFTRHMEGRSPYQEMFGDETTLAAFEPSRFPFHDRIANLLVQKGIIPAPVPLAELHRHLSADAMAYNTSELNTVSEALFDTDGPFARVYEAFIRDFLQDEVFRTPLYFQATPTIRCHFPGARGFDWPPRYHTDVMLGHPPQSINIWLPVTDCRTTDTFRVGTLAESLALLKEFGYRWPEFVEARDTDPDVQSRCAEICPLVHPAECEAVVFDARCVHACQLIETGLSRVSLDIRVLPVDVYDAMEIQYRGTGRRRMKFIPGEYYDIRRSDEI